MITMLTASTLEIDEVDVAVAEILEQLDLGNGLRKHAVAILSCYPEFIDTGVVKALCKSLPCDVVGCTTLASGTARQNGTMMLAVQVITSDEVSFATAISAPLTRESNFDPMKDAYMEASAKLPGAPAMAIPLLPVLDFVNSDSLVEALDEISSGLPLFGTLPCDHTTNYGQSFLVHNGEVFENRLVLLLLSGPISPRFHIVSLSEERGEKQHAIITASDGNILREVNGVPLLKYLETIGLCDEANVETAKVVPFIVNYNDGTTPVVRGIYRFTPDGNAMCGGRVPCNSTLSIGAVDYNDVISSTKRLLTEVRAREGVNLILGFSCICRGWVLGTDVLAEFDCVQEACGDIPYLMFYSGGEICPVYNEEGQHFNRFHNYSCIVCTL